MKIGILGSGDVAKALAAGLLAQGHSVMLGTRDTARLADFARAHPGIQLGSPAQAADFAQELAILAVKGSAALQVLRDAGAGERLAGKVVIDTTNPIADAPPVEGVFSFFTGHNESLLERLQAAFPALRLVKAFNHMGFAAMVNPQLPDRPTMFLAGNDAAAKAQVAQLLPAFGWEHIDMGPAIAARAIEPLCILWCIPGFRHDQWQHAFKLLRPATWPESLSRAGA